MSDSNDKTRAVDQDALAAIRRAARLEHETTKREVSAHQDMPSEQPPVDPQANDAGPAKSKILKPDKATSSRDAAREMVSRRAAEPSAKPEVLVKQSKPRLPMIAALVIGFWLIAGALFLALRTSGGNDEVVLADESAASTDIELALPTATVLDANVGSSEDAPADATPTPVPPTPEWRPANEGPRSAPFTFIVEAIVKQPVFFEARDGSELVPAAEGRPLPLANPTSSGAPLVLRVVGGGPDDEWAQVALPGSPDVVWVKSEEFVWGSSNRLLQVDIASNMLRVFEGNEQIFETPVASGDRDRATPQVSTFILENASRVGDLEGSNLFRLASIAPAVGTDLDGLRTLSVGITDDFELIGRYTTDGKMLIERTVAADLGSLIAAGSKVEIVGTPPPPTPTPNPTPDSIFQAPPTSGGGGFADCPSGALGVPPNCYRIVDRLVVRGACTSFQLEINGSCMIFGGDPVVTDSDSQCPSSAPEEISGRCYVRVGPVPETPGACPPGSQDIDRECRVPA